MLNDDEILTVTRDLFKRHRDELPGHDRVYDYVRGRRGVPSVPEGAGDELTDLARMSVKNVLSLVRDAFAQNLAVVGFRSASEAENEAVWGTWQAQRLDARQAEVHRSAVTYGTSYAVATNGIVRLRTPRQIIAVYADPQVDEWPIYALETWVDQSGPRPVRRGTLYDSEFIYPLNLGFTTKVKGELPLQVTPRYEDDAETLSDPKRHGASVCPVVRFVNARDAEDMVVGEVEPLIDEQRAINTVNFDRLTVSRFGAFPQKYAIGWSASGAAELARASAARLMAFEDETVKVGDFKQASVEPYNSILEEMLVHVAMEAQIPVSAFGKMVNLSADALAMAEAPHQRKLIEKRESFGESWEQLLRLLAEMDGEDVREDAEVIWRDTEARSFAQVVDGIVKLNAAGVPIETLLEDVPGWSQQRVDAARNAIRRGRGSVVLEQLRTSATQVSDASRGHTA